MKSQERYFGRIRKALKTALQGLRITGRHYRRGYQREAPLGIQDPEYFQKTQGPITIQYPAAKVPVPDTGRYRLHMETDDCIGCDKCARICPVDCITIETFRADGDLGRTSDGTVKRLHLPVFDIDMGKCMYCGLCTTVCPTECLTMTKVYDYSEYDRDNLVYHFGAYSPESEQQIRLETEAALEKKKAEKAASAPKASPEEKPGTEPAARPRPMLRPKPVSPETPQTPETPESAAPETPPTEESKPQMRPRPMIKRRPAEDTPPADAEAPATPEDSAPETPPAQEPRTPRPRPLMKRPPKDDPDTPSTE